MLGCAHLATQVCPGMLGFILVSCMARVCSGIPGVLNGVNFSNPRHKKSTLHFFDPFFSQKHVFQEVAGRRWVIELTGSIQTMFHCKTKTPLHYLYSRERTECNREDYGRFGECKGGVREILLSGYILFKKIIPSLQMAVRQFMTECFINHKSLLDYMLGLGF